MSQLPDRLDRPGVVVQKQGANIYTGLLLVSFLALCIGILMLCMEMARYEWNFKVPSTHKVSLNVPAAGAAFSPTAAHATICSGELA